MTWTLSMRETSMCSSVFGKIVRSSWNGPGFENDRNQLAKLESVLLGERNLGQQVLEIVVFGYDKPEEAEAALRRDVEAMIQT